MHIIDKGSSDTTVIGREYENVTGGAVPRAEQVSDVLAIKREHV
jgi:hypothetical protein